MIVPVSGPDWTRLGRRRTWSATDLSGLGGQRSQFEDVYSPPSLTILNQLLSIGHLWVNLEVSYISLQLAPGAVTARDLEDAKSPALRAVFKNGPVPSIQLLVAYLTLAAVVEHLWVVRIPRIEQIPMLGSRPRIRVDHHVRGALGRLNATKARTAKPRRDLAPCGDLAHLKIPPIYDLLH